MSIDQIASGSADDIAAGLVSTFADLHGHAPIGCFAAPGRVNLIGEHLDYNGGMCLPMALPHASYAVLAARRDERVTIASLQSETPWTGRLHALGPGQVEGWPAYVAGVAWALQENGVVLPGLDIVVDSRVPIGAGLSSSAALECSVAVGLCELSGVVDSDEVRRMLVAACMRAESEVVGAPTGGMDQTISLLARADHALLIDCADWSTEHLPWQPASAGLELLVVDTRAAHSLADGGYASRRRDCESASQQLGVASLRDVVDSEAALAALTGDRVRRRARHVFTEMARVAAAVEQLRNNDFSGLGDTFNASHESLRNDFEVSCPELDAVVRAAAEGGALGARMTGAGFGGSAIALVPRDKVVEVGAAITSAFDSHGWPRPGFLLAQPSDGARKVC